MTKYQPGNQVVVFNNTEQLLGIITGVRDWGLYQYDVRTKHGNCGYAEAKVFIEKGQPLSYIIGEIYELDKELSSEAQKELDFLLNHAQDVISILKEDY